MPPKYITFYIIPGGARMREGVYRGTAEHNFIRMVVPLIIIRREIGLLVWLFETCICILSHTTPALRRVKVPFFS